MGFSMVRRGRAAVIGAALWLAASGLAEAVSVGDKLDSFQVSRIPSGSGLSAADLNGKVTVINFWATWCEACKVELVEMEKLLLPLEAKGLKLAFVSLDKDPDKAATWFKKNLKSADPMVANLYSDASFTVADKLSVDSFPLTLVVGRDGKVTHIQRGFKEGDGSTEVIAKLVGKLLATPAH